jgi:hypothetical protein
LGESRPRGQFLLSGWEERGLEGRSLELYNKMKFDLAHRTQEKVGKVVGAPACGAGKENEPGNALGRKGSSNPNY